LRATRGPVARYPVRTYDLARPFVVQLTVVPMSLRGAKVDPKARFDDRGSRGVGLDNVAALVGELDCPGQGLTGIPEARSGGPRDGASRVQHHCARILLALNVMAYRTGAQVLHVEGEVGVTLAEVARDVGHVRSGEREDVDLILIPSAAEAETIAAAHRVRAPVDHVLVAAALFIDPHLERRPQGLGAFQCARRGCLSRRVAIVADDQRRAQRERGGNAGGASWATRTQSHPSSLPRAVKAQRVRSVAGR
jgi:hypothetical protein